MKTIFYGMRYLSPEIWNVNLLFVSCVWLEQRVCYFRIGFVAAIHFYNILSITLWRFSLFSWEYEWVGMVEGIGGGGRENSILHCCIPTLLTLLLFSHKTSHIISSPPYFKFKIRLSLVSTEKILIQTGQVIAKKSWGHTMPLPVVKLCLVIRFCGWDLSLTISFLITYLWK